MRLAKFSGLTLILLTAALLHALPPNGAVSGKITFIGTLPKQKSLDLSKEPQCVKMHAADPLLPETFVAGPGNALRNVVVYVSQGGPVSSTPPSQPVLFNQQGCQYTTHVLAFRVGQEVNISNSDPFSHNIHPLAKINREWNKIQPAGTPPFTYAYDQEEFIPVKCNLHSWMQGYFVILKTPFFAVTGDDGRFTLADLPPGHYTVTAWHEALGTLHQDITISGAEAQTINFTFNAKL